MKKMPKRQNLRDLRRRPPAKAPATRLLLICEGEKTETLYFSLFVERLKAANVELKVVGGECGNDPLSIVNEGKARLKEDKGIDECYCIIDRDSHAHFDRAISEARDFNNALGERRKLETIKSFPCFEYWFILHYKFSRSPYATSGKKSPGDCAVDHLKELNSNYDKSNIKFMISTIDLTDTAIKHSTTILTQAYDENEYNPSTEVHVLINKLRSLGA